MPDESASIRPERGVLLGWDGTPRTIRSADRPSVGCVRVGPVNTASTE